MLPKTSTTNSIDSTLVTDLEDARAEIRDLREKMGEALRRIEWFERQLFGRTSEVRAPGPSESGMQLTLGTLTDAAASSLAQKQATQVPAHTRRAPKRDKDHDFVTDEGLRFGAGVPIEEVHLPEPEETRNLPAESKKWIGKKEHYRLAQQSSYKVIKYTQDTFGLRGADDEVRLVTSPLPAPVIPGSFVDVTFLAGMSIDKFQFHLPSYRIHQRLAQEGITIARATLTNLEHHVGELLAVIVDAIHRLALTRGVIIMDETPRRVWVKEEGKMKKQYMWLLRTATEVFFAMGPDRSGRVIFELLGSQITCVLITDGYQEYDYFEVRAHGVIHAYCMSHSRRNFIDAESAELELSTHANQQFFQPLYRIEAEIRQKQLVGEPKREYRQTYSKPLMEDFHQWLKNTHAKLSLLPKNPLTVACAYMLKRWQGLTVFLEYPDVPIDTNEGEREMRAHAVGRKNWLHNMSETGADHVCTFYTIIQTCKLLGIDPNEYLVDVLPKVRAWPRERIVELSPLMWKSHRNPSPAA